MTLTETYVRHLFAKLKSSARKAVDRGRYDLAMKYLEMACHTAYTFYIGFSDAEIEGMIEEISGKVIRPRSLVQRGERRRVAFLDTFSQDTQGLTMQYVEAIISAGWDLLYVTSFNLQDSRARNINKVLSSFERGKIVTVPSGMKPVAKSRFIYDSLMDFGPQDIFLHISPSAVSMACAAYSLPQDITRYQINLTDHTYWVGAGCMDYSFEFRPYGASLSVEQRGFASDRILMLPYYPVMKETSFDGFPAEADGKVKIFSGASYYKIIDREDTFFKLNKAILDRHPEAVTLFAGGGDTSLLSSLIDKYGLRGRFIPIDQRNDIYQCYLHSDIYLSSYPLWGGLMGQYAAHASLPILAYKGQSKGLLEEVICQRGKIDITSNTIDKVVSEADRLIEDEEYRREKGTLVNSCVIGKDEFEESFVKAVSTHSSPYPVNIELPLLLHDLNVEDKLKLMNSNGEFAKTFFNTLGMMGIKISPKLWCAGFRVRLGTSRLVKMLLPSR